MNINSGQKISISQPICGLNNKNLTSQDIYSKDSFNSAITFKAIGNEKNNKLGKAVLEFSRKEAEPVYEKLSEQAKINLAGSINIGYMLHEYGLSGFMKALPFCLINKFYPIIPSKNMGEQTLARIMVLFLFKVDKKCIQFPRNLRK